jgi:hypothetical protein
LVIFLNSQVIRLHDFFDIAYDKPGLKKPGFFVCNFCCITRKRLYMNIYSAYNRHGVGKAYPEVGQIQLIHDRFF